MTQRALARLLMEGRTRPITEPTYLLLQQTHSIILRKAIIIFKPNISIFSAKHTVLILISMCLCTVADSYDTTIAG